MAQESVFGLLAASGGQQDSRGAAPRIVSYKNIAATAPNDVKVKMHVDSSQVESILNPVRGVRDAQLRAGIKPTNHARHNVLSVKEQSRLNAVRKQQEAEDRAEVEAAMREGRPPRLQQSSSSAANSRPGTQGATGQATAGSLPRRRSLDPSTPGRGKDFIAENRVAAAAAQRPVKAEARREPGEAYLGKRDYGRVPQYLLERKMQMAADYEAQLAAKEAALIPPGMRLLPEEERQETLALLAHNREEVTKQLAALPIIIETPTMIRRKDDLERRLHEIEDATRVFSRTKVLVRA